MNKIFVTCGKCSDNFLEKKTVRTRPNNGRPCNDEIEYNRKSGNFLVPASQCYEDEGTLIVDFKCPNGHITKNILGAQIPEIGDCGWQYRTGLGMQRYEFLFNLGVSSFIDFYYRESIMNFSSALERFLQFAINIMAKVNGIDSKNMEISWKLVEKQSERQCGAFIFSWLFFEKIPYTDMSQNQINKMVNIRNNAVHQGHLSSEGDCRKYGDYVIKTIGNIDGILYKKYRNHYVDYRTSFLEKMIERCKKEKVRLIMNSCPSSLGAAVASGFDSAVEEIKAYRENYILQTPDALS